MDDVDIIYSVYDSTYYKISDLLWNQQKVEHQDNIKSFYRSLIRLFIYHNFSAWINNYIHYKVWDETNFPFPNALGGTLKFMNG